MLYRKHCPTCNDETFHEGRDGHCVHCLAQSLKNPAAPTLGRGYAQCMTCNPWLRPDGSPEALTLHVDGECMVCAAKGADAGRIERELKRRGSTPEKIEFMLHELRTRNYLDRNGGWWHLDSAGTPQPEQDTRRRPVRGLTAKNIRRVLLRGKRQREKTGTPVELAPDSPIRQRVGWLWRRFIALPGYAGRRAARAAATTTKRKASRQAEAVALRARGMTEREIVQQMKKSGHIKAGTSIESAIRNVRRWLRARP